MDAVERALPTDEQRVSGKVSETGRDGKRSRGTRGLASQHGPCSNTSLGRENLICWWDQA
eukprot:3313333-Rhodomonas_salina.1